MTAIEREGALLKAMSTLYKSFEITQHFSHGMVIVHLYLASRCFI